MRTLYLHIGHGKTGTSYQQSCFALSREALAGPGIAIVYPQSPKRDRADKGGVSSGNAVHMAKSLCVAADALKFGARHRSEDGHLFYSSEFLFHRMTLLKSPDTLLAFADSAGCERVKILMLIRDPMDHMRSAYLQNVQRAGETGSIDEMANRFNMPMRASALMQTYKHPRIEITVRNYSRMKDHLIEETETWLGLTPGTLLRPPQSRVNRSLTGAEMEMQRVFNEAFGASGRLFADHVVDALPDLTPDYPVMSLAARQIAHDRCEKAMRRINQAIPDDQAYQFDLNPARASDESTPDEGDNELLTLSQAQVDAIVDALTPRIKRRFRFKHWLR